MIETLEELIGDILGIHQKEVFVTIDEDVVTYTVTSDSYADVLNLHEVISRAEFVDEISAELVAKDSDIIVESSRYSLDNIIRLVYTI
mgnify:CR=1 FL=1